MTDCTFTRERSVDVTPDVGEHFEGTRLHAVEGLGATASGSDFGASTPAVLSVSM